jgi:hypothetical protein
MRFFRPHRAPLLAVPDGESNPCSQTSGHNQNDSDPIIEEGDTIGLVLNRWRFRSPSPFSGCADRSRCLNEIGAIRTARNGLVAE